MSVSILGQNIKKIREAKGISAYRLAKESGVSGATISQIESGKRQTLKGDSLEKIASALKVSVDDLLSMEDGIEYESDDLEEIIQVILNNVELKLDNIVLTKREKEDLAVLFKVAIEFIRTKRKI